MLDFLACSALDESTKSRLQVVFEELVSNIIRHGFSRHSDQSIHVRIDRRPDMVEFIFEDDGTPFNPLDAAAPEIQHTSIESARVGGLRIPLVKAIFVATAVRASTAECRATTGFRPRIAWVLAVAT